MWLLRYMFLALCAVLMAGCANFQSSVPAPIPVHYYQIFPKPEPVVAAPSLTPIKAVSDTKRYGKKLVGPKAVEDANKAAVVQPSSLNTIHSIIVYSFEAGQVYQVYTQPLHVTDLQLQPGEQSISVAAGDTTRWQISKTMSGGADGETVEHLLIKPMVENVDTTLVITTNQRTYYILLKSLKETFMTSVQWHYHDQPAAAKNAVDAEGSVMHDLSAHPERFDSSYKSKVMRGDTPDWMPKSVFNDGMKTYIEFPAHIQSAPALFIKESGSGDAAVNYRVVGNYYVIDQVITGAELTSGMGQLQTVVDIIYKKP